MCFNLHNSRTDSGGPIDFFDVLDAHIRQADSAAFAFVGEALHGAPGFGQRHTFVVNGFALCVAWILVFTWSKGKGSVNQVKVGVIESESFEAGLESGLDSFWAMIVVPELCSDEQFIAPS